MKNVLPVIVFFLFNMMLAAETVDLWSSREIVLPGTGKWELAAEHGRILGSGTGEARFEIPQLADGATLDAVLTRNGEMQKLRFHSPKPLVGISAGTLELPLEKEKLLKQYGLSDAIKKRPDIWFGGAFPLNAAGRLFLIFPDKRDFPLNIGKDWEGISFESAKIAGSLSVLYDKKEQLLELDGAFTYAEFRKAEKTVIVFSPEFDLGKIENILLIKQLITGGKWNTTIYF